MNFQKILSLLLCGCFLLGTGVLSVTVGAASVKTYSLTEHTNKYKTQGRTLLTNDGLLVDWSASGIEFEANCSGNVYLDLNVINPPSSEIKSCYFTVIVDGKTKPRDYYRIYGGESNKGKKSFTIATGLSSGNHTFKIYRQTQIDEGTNIKMTAIRLNGELLPAPAKKDFYIEFVGDSITVGKGNLGDTAGTAEYMDATQSYGYLTAKSLDADYSLVAVSAIGASVGWTKYNMQQVYPKWCYLKDESTDYDFSRQPDVVVLALGTNDYQCRETELKTWKEIKQGFADMLDLVRQKNPNTKVIWIHGMMTNEVSYLIEEVISEAGGSSKGLYALELDQNNEGYNGHPIKEAHKIYAKKLTEKIKSLFPSLATTSKTTVKTTSSKSTTVSKSTSKTNLKTTTTTQKSNGTTTTPRVAPLVTEFDEPSIIDGTTQTSETTTGNNEQGTTFTEKNAMQPTAPVSGTPNEEKPKDNLLGKVIAIVAAAIVVLGGVAFFIFKKVKK